MKNLLLFMVLLMSGCVSTSRIEIMSTRDLQDTQITFGLQSHSLDNNDNFSADGRYLCYDTRESVGPGIEHGYSIEVVDLTDNRPIIVYAPDAIMTGETPAPGIGAVSFSQAVPEVSFIHGPPVSETEARGFYGKPNRNGACVRLSGEVVERDGTFHMVKDGHYAFSWLDKRDVSTDRDTEAGAHRGGTHRHEYCARGDRIGFTYDDFLLPQYDRTIGYMEPHENAPAPASHFFALLVAVAPMGQAGPGELEKAYGDAWVDPDGTMRAFIGKIRCENGVDYEESLFVADIPRSVDITTADAGSASRYPQPPLGITLRRLTSTFATGIVRGAPDGKRIAYYAKDARGVSQVFIIDALGSDKAEDPALRPIQVTSLPKGTKDGIRWTPDGKAILCISDDGLVLTSIVEGDGFGKSVFLTPHGDGINRHAPAFSPDGKRLAYNRPVPTGDDTGQVKKAYDGSDFVQIFILEKNDQKELSSIFD